ncbi:MAG: SMP-30/gluconolactonase/LRE family protein [Vicinamibacterales bacterium]
MKRIALLLCLATPLLAAAQTVERAAEVPALTEGPTVDRDGNVYFTELRAQKIYKLTPAGELTVFREPSHGANGLVIDPQGRLIACEGNAEGHTPRITRTDLRTGAIEVLADNFQGMPFRGANDVTIDGRGRVYFTEPAGNAIYRIDGPGQVSRVVAAPDIRAPNGLQISPDDRTLYVIEAGAPPATAPRVIRALDLQPDGTARNGRVIYDFRGRSADGMSVDVQGNLYVSAGLNQLAPPGAVAAARAWTADALKTKAGVYVISPAGKLLKFIPISEDVITNNAFGGPDMKTLYVTSGRTVFMVRTDIAGLPR